jgi:hypothetical protein
MGDAARHNPIGVNSIPTRLVPGEILPVIVVSEVV